MSCLACKHYEIGSKCAAFPEKIPLEIIAGEVRHLEKFPGQVGDAVFEVGENPANKGILETN